MALSEEVRSGQGEFFSLSVPGRAAHVAFAAVPHVASARALVLALAPGGADHARTSSHGVVPVVPFPFASRALVTLCRDSGGYLWCADDVDIFLSRRIFDDIADEVGTERIAQLPLRLGMAAADPVMTALGRSLDLIVGGAGTGREAVVDGVAHSLNVHLAETYGAMRGGQGDGGGFARWQLRFAMRALRDLNSPASIEEIAKACGLSTGHFSRAFKRRTGRSPHQWIILHRIGAAKALIDLGNLSLAEIALACQFSDQSHLTRAFVNVTGMTPGRWRDELGEPGCAPRHAGRLEPETNRSGRHRHARGPLPGGWRRGVTDPGQDIALPG